MRLRTASNGSTLYSISVATPGYEVVVTVAAVDGAQHAACATSFTPHA